MPERGLSAPAEAERIAVAFARVLRGSGIDVPVGRAVTFAEALTLTGVDRSGPVYWAGRTTLIGRPEDIPVYDRAFDAFWRQRVGMTLVKTPPVELTIVLDTEEEEAAGEGEDEPVQPEGPTLVVRWSRQEVLRHKDFAAYTHAEFEEARRLMNDLRLHGAMRRSRRRRPSRKAEGRPDLRRTVRRRSGRPSALRDGRRLRERRMAPCRRRSFINRRASSNSAWV